MEFYEVLPFWDKLTEKQKNALSGSVIHRTIEKGTIVHDGSVCTGLLLVKSGQLRAYILSDEGREITIYRLFDWDICLFSASCVLNSIQFEIIIEADQQVSLEVICEQMGRTPPWIPGIELRADGYECNFYQKQ